MQGPGPTQFLELNEVLADFTRRVRALLGGNFVGAYLQGSFALGDGDEFSDVDFIVVIREDIPDAGVPALNAMHATLHDRPESWAQHLEGSYAPAPVLRRLAGAIGEVPGTERPAGWTDPGVSGGKVRNYPFLFLNNGDRCLVRSEHDNTQVVRRVLWEHGIVLAGPSPRTLIDPVAPDELRDEIREAMRSFGQALLDGATPIDALWMQGFTVLLFCRMLHGLETATITSKPECVRWAREHLDQRWAPLIEGAWTQRSRYPRGRSAPLAHAALRPDLEDVAHTLDFVRYALDRASLR